MIKTFTARIGRLEGKLSAAPDVALLEEEAQYYEEGLEMFDRIEKQEEKEKKATVTKKTSRPKKK